MEKFRIPAGEIKERQENLLELAHQDGHDGVIVFEQSNIQYLSNFYHALRFRPVALAVTDGAVRLLLPRVESPTLERNDDIVVDQCHIYHEYPESEPIDKLVDICTELRLDRGSVAVDRDGPADVLGLGGLAASDVLDADVLVENYVRDLRRVKSSRELNLYREGAKWSHLAQQTLKDQIEPGRSPMVVASEVEPVLIQQLYDSLGSMFTQRSVRPPIEVNFSAGELTYHAHNPDQQPRVNEGDVIETRSIAYFDNYPVGKTERCMFVGEPSREQRGYFSLIVEAQDLLFDAIEPGLDYAAAAELVTAFFKENDVADLQHHRPGHGMGLDWMELPILDIGLEGQFSVGEVFTIEPALNVPGLGSFRHNDTAVVTDDGIELLTHYPRDIESMTIPV